MDDGSTRYFEAFRCQYSSHIGPCKGGIRFHPKVSQDEVRNRLHDKLKISFDEMWLYQHQSENTSLRSAAYAKALKKLEQVINMRGTKEYFSNTE